MSQSRARTTRKDQTLRDKLARKRAKVEPVFYPLDEKGEKAVQRVEDADRELKLARIFVSKDSRSDVDISALEKAVDEAEAEREKHCLVIRIRGLTDDERDALASEYTPDEYPKNADADQRKEVDDRNAKKVKEWTYAALEAAVLDSDLTADEWRQELTSDRWTAGDVEKLRVGIQLAYGASPAGGIPKG